VAEKASASTLRRDLEDVLESGGRLGAVLIEGAEERTAVDPDGRYPLASVRKVVTLGGYGLAIDSGVCDPAERVLLTQIDRWFWVGRTARDPPSGRPSAADTIPVARAVAGSGRVWMKSPVEAV